MKLMAEVSRLRSIGNDRALAQSAYQVEPKSVDLGVHVGGLPLEIYDDAEGLVNVAHGPEVSCEARSSQLRLCEPVHARFDLP